MKLKSDRYKKARGGPSRLFTISCRECGAAICRYQKDGVGNLRRMYVDRIFSPEVSLAGKALACPKGHILGMKIVYKKEGRPAFRLITGAVAKETVGS